MRPAAASISLACLLISCSCIAAQTPATEQSKPQTAPSIHQMYLDDQSEVPAGKPGGIAPITGEEFNARGEVRRAKIRAMLANGDVHTGADFHDAALLFQHGETADDYLLAHILAVEAVIKGEDSSKWLAAATLDRYLQSIKQPQVFGTQYPLDPNAPPSTEPVDPHAGRFKGRMQSPFNDQLLPDTLRHDLCVPDLAQQKQNLATLNSGSYPGSAMVAPGCKR
jgi:hypothetical protein